MNAHGVDVFDRADDDAIVRFVANHFHLIFFPAENAFFNQHFADGACGDATGADALKFVDIIGDAAARAAQGEARANDGRQAHEGQGEHGFFNRVGHLGLGAFQPDLVHRVAEFQAVFGLFDDVGLRANHLNIIFRQHPGLFQRQRTVQRCLPTHGRQNRVGTLFGDDQLNHFWRDRLHIGGVGQIGVRHDGGRVGIDQNDPVALFLQSLTSLHARIVKFTGLPDHNGAGPDDQNGFQVCAFRHGGVRSKL